MRDDKDATIAAKDAELRRADTAYDNLVALRDAERKAVRQSDWLVWLVYYFPSF